MGEGSTEKKRQKKDAHTLEIIIDQEAATDQLYWRILVDMELQELVRDMESFLKFRDGNYEIVIYNPDEFIFI